MSGESNPRHVCPGCKAEPAQAWNDWHDGIAGVCLDMDGTMAETEEHVHTPSWNNGMHSCLKARGLECPHGQERLTECLDDKTKFAWHRATGNPEPQASQRMVDILNHTYGTDIPASELTAARMQYLQGSGIQLEPIAYIPEILEICRVKDIRTGVCTSSRRDYAEWLLGQIGLFSSSYGALIGAEDVECAGHFKPSAMPWGFLFYELGIHKTRKHILVLEDSLTSALGALAAHPRTRIFLLAQPEAVFRSREWDRKKIQPREWAERVQVVHDWSPVLDVLKLCQTGNGE